MTPRLAMLALLVALIAHPGAANGEEGTSSSQLRPTNLYVEYPEASQAVLSTEWRSGDFFAPPAGLPGDLNATCQTVDANRQEVHTYRIDARSLDSAVSEKARHVQLNESRPPVFHWYLRTEAVSAQPLRVQLVGKLFSGPDTLLATGNTDFLTLAGSATETLASTSRTRGLEGAWQQGAVWIYGFVFPLAVLDETSGPDGLAVEVEVRLDNPGCDVATIMPTSLETYGSAEYPARLEVEQDHPLALDYLHAKIENRRAVVDFRARSAWGAYDINSTATLAFEGITAVFHPMRDESGTFHWQVDLDSIPFPAKRATLTILDLQGSASLQTTFTLPVERGSMAAPEAPWVPMILILVACAARHQRSQR